jgi:hypothetical protein
MGGLRRFSALAEEECLELWSPCSHAQCGWTCCMSVASWGSRETQELNIAPCFFRFAPHREGLATAMGERSSLTRDLRQRQEEQESGETERVVIPPLRSLGSSDREGTPFSC